MGDGALSRSNDVIHARFVRLWLPAWMIERSHVAQKSSGGLPFDFAKSVMKFDFVKENSFVLSKHTFSKFDNRGLMFCRA